jgi:phytanoyl-CoA hydroxylase
MLSRAQRQAFETDGYLVLPGFLAGEACAALLDRALALAERAAASAPPTVFSPALQRANRDSHFLASAGAIAAFFDEGGQAAGAAGVNKLGHALHDLDPLFERASYDPRLGAMARDLGQADPRPLQSTVIFKHARTGGEVIPHQDSMYLFTEPPSCLGFWFALEDATIENGCLMVLAGGHGAPPAARYRRQADGSVGMDRGLEGWLAGAPFRPLEAARGTLVVLHGCLPHRSGPNRSQRSRGAYTLHVIDGACPYADDNWLQRPPAMPLRPLPDGPAP